jgi:hypothetical protein
MFKDQAAAREQELQDEMETMATELSGQVASLQSELDSVLDFKQRKVDGAAYPSRNCCYSSAAVETAHDSCVTLEATLLVTKTTCSSQLT